jgi:hypothetical protein
LKYNNILFVLRGYSTLSALNLEVFSARNFTLPLIPFLTLPTPSGASLLIMENSALHYHSAENECLQSIDLNMN